jgi:hypothetical protein
MKFKILLVIILAVCLIPCLAQKRETRSSDVRIVKNLPNVYLSFEREGKIESLYEGESNQRVWLRFHNNSKWKVMFCSSPVPKKYGETDADYEIERYKGSGEIPGTRNSDTCGYLLLDSGKSVLFSVPKEHLTKGLAIKIQFRYEWEIEPDGTDNLLEPKHYAFFYSEDISGK